MIKPAHHLPGVSPNTKDRAMGVADEGTDERDLPVMSLIAAIAAISVVGLGFGHSTPLFSVLLDRYGASDFVVGSNTAFGAISALLGAPFYPRIIAKVGLRLFLVICLGIMVIPYLAVFWAGDRLWMWYPLRFIFSVGGAGVFAASEIWINGLAPDRMRGKILGIYTTFLALGFACGPLILTVTGYDGFLPFIVGAAVFSCAAIPLLFVRAPHVANEEHGDIFAPMRRFPVLFTSAAMFAAVESAMLIFLPILALELNYGVNVGARALTIYGLGLLSAQLPVGWLTDKVSPRRVMTGCALLGAGFALLVPLTQGQIWLLYAVLFIWGGAVGALYTVGLIVVGNTFKGSALASANTAFVFTYAAGAVLGPFIAGTARYGFGANGLMVVIALALGAYAWAARRSLGEAE
ncbi:MAG: MFS transporter [Pseudomonadota bacterium]